MAKRLFSTILSDEAVLTISNLQSDKVVLVVLTAFTRSFHSPMLTQECEAFPGANIAIASSNVSPKRGILSKDMAVDLCQQ
jgi:hypothetical protein